MSPWSSEVVSKTKQLPSPAGKKEISNLYHSPWAPVSFPGRPHGRKNDIDKQFFQVSSLCGSSCLSYSPKRVIRFYRALYGDANMAA